MTVFSKRFLFFRIIRLGLELGLGLRLGLELTEIRLKRFRSNVHSGKCTRWRNGEEIILDYNRISQAWSAS